MEKKGKLELTWVGKYEEEKLEPRILIEDKSKSYGDPNTENMLIHGDNLLALKALENDYSGNILFLYNNICSVVLTRYPPCPKPATADLSYVI